MNISVVGLGKLGAVLAAVMADRGHEVIGVDINPAAVDAINEGRTPVREPGLDEMIRGNAGRLSATTDLEAAVNRRRSPSWWFPRPPFRMEHFRSNM